MKEKEFKKLLKEYEPKKIIYLYTTSQINLTSKQLNKVIELKNKQIEKISKTKVNLFKVTEL